jgi:hypothetical protein
MTLRSDQAISVDGELLGRFIAAVKAVSAGIVEEDPTTPNHAARIALAKRAMLERQADNYGRVILELAIARNVKLIAARAAVEDQDILDCVTRYLDRLAAEGW